MPAPSPSRAVYSTVAADEIARCVEAAYAVGRVADCGLARRGFNDVYELQLADGRRHVARLSGLRARGEANVGYETALLWHLQRAGVAVAAPLRTRDGAGWTTLRAAEGTRALVVFDHLEGEPPGETLADIGATGAGLAQIHAASASYEGPASRYTLDLPHLLQRPLARLLAVSTLDDALRAHFSSAADRVAQRIAGMPALSRVACHGDCHGGNNFMGDGPGGARIASFFDFDDAGPGYLAYDLAVFLWAALHGKPEPDATAQDQWAHYVEGYRRVRDIPAADLEAIVPFVVVRHFWFMGEHAGRIDQSGTQSLPRVWLTRQVDVLAAWTSMALPARRPKEGG